MFTPQRRDEVATRLVDRARADRGSPARLEPVRRHAERRIAGLMTLVRSVDSHELTRALVAAVDAFTAELRERDAVLADRLTPILHEIPRG